MTDVSADDVDVPLAFSGQRLDWRDLPRHVRRRIAELAGAEVTAESTATCGFSPGFVAVLELSDGRAVFVKAVSPRENPSSPDLARAEIRVARDLPEQVPAPRLLWWDDDGEWVLVGWAAVPGRTPQLPWRRDELDLVLAEVNRLAAVRPAAGHGLAGTPDVLGADFVGWRSLAAAGPDAADWLVATLGEAGRWAVDHLEPLVAWERTVPEVLAGDALVHGDLRSDNIMIDEHRTVWFIDWPHASVGAPWLDTAFLLPSVAAEGGGDPATLFAAQPVADGVTPDDLRAALVGLAGYFAWGCLQPAQTGLPNLRAYQVAQARTTLAWLHRLT